MAVTRKNWEGETFFRKVAGRGGKNRRNCYQNKELFVPLGVWDKSGARVGQDHATAGYSGTPLVRKLGIREGFLVAAIDAPENYLDLLAPVPDGVRIAVQPLDGADIVHFFTNSRDALFSKLAEYVRLIKQDGSIWVSWYKKAAKLPTEITEDTVREAAFPLGLVDIKVCAVDDRWSGLKLVIRRENRI